MPLSLAAQLFLSLFSSISGQKWRSNAVPFQVAQDAEACAKMEPPITAEELRLVFLYVKAELRTNRRTPLNESSLLWHNLMADNAMRFQGLLHLAQQAVAKGHLRVPGQSRPGNVVQLVQPETEETGRAIAEKLAQFKASL